MTSNDRTRTITTRFSPTNFDRLRFRALHHNATPEGYIKQILNNHMANRTLPDVDLFNANLPATQHHPPNAVTLVTPYPPIYLQYIDHLIDTLPPIYSTTGRSRRRIIETLTLINLFNYCDEGRHDT
jgi:hypothetical protein